MLCDVSCFNASLSGRDDTIKNVCYLWQPKMNIYYVAAKETMQAGFATYFGIRRRDFSRTDLRQRC
jgi:hypothetical protein